MNGSICAGGDQDWFQFRLVEQHEDLFGGTDLRARITLAMTAGGSDLDLCVVNLATNATQCSNLPGTSTETVNVSVSDTSGDDSTNFAIEVIGATTSSANTYTLTVRGNP